MLPHIAHKYTYIQQFQHILASNYTSIMMVFKKTKTLRFQVIFLGRVHQSTAFLYFSALKFTVYVLVNASEKATGGPFTRYEPCDPNNNGRKSVLDLVIVSSELETYIESLQIDQNMFFTPSRPIHKDLRHSDHYALLLILRKLPTNQGTQIRAKNVIRWNTNKPGG